MSRLEDAKNTIVNHSRMQFGTKPIYDGVRCYVKVCATREYTKTAAGEGGASFFQYIKDTQEEWLALSEHLGGEIVFAGEWLDPEYFTDQHPMTALSQPMFNIHSVCIDSNCVFAPELIEKIAPDLDQVIAINWTHEPEYFDSLDELERKIGVRKYKFSHRALHNDDLHWNFGVHNAVQAVVFYPGDRSSQEILVHTKIEVGAEGARI